MTKQRTISRSVLEELYVNQGLTIAEIARKLHAGNSTIGRELRDHGIHISTNSEAHTKHGMSQTRQYRIWQSIKTRCANPKNPNYENYGGQGISYPVHWETFEGFWDDMEDGYADDKTIDRIDGSQDYSPENCRWVSYQGQNRNKSDNVLLTLNDRTQCVAAWAEEVDIPQGRLYARKQAGWSDKRTLTTPVMSEYDR